jgi:hypothetical protein
MAAAAAVMPMAVPWHCWRSIARSLDNDNNNNGGNGVDNGGLALLAIPVCLPMTNTAAVAAQMMVPWHRHLSLACSRNKGGGCSGMDNSALALSTVPCSLA